MKRVRPGIKVIKPDTTKPTLAFDGKIDFARLPMVAPSVMIVSAFMAGVLTFLNQTPAVTHSKPVESQPPRFLERLPLKLRGGQIYAISAEDHYLRIHTSRGSDMILMRLSDAIVELDGIEGSQVHRSWWVARDALEGVERGEGKAVFTLKDGTKAPVSRTFSKALRQAGWY
jgi:DNA-binding LytR/AlgR family response regulator